jgi:hypothetical protein
VSHWVNSGGLQHTISREDIHAAMPYAAGTLAHEEVVFIGKESAERQD